MFWQKLYSSPRTDKNLLANVSTSCRNLMNRKNIFSLSITAFRFIGREFHTLCWNLLYVSWTPRGIVESLGGIVESTFHYASQLFHYASELLALRQVISIQV